MRFRSASPEVWHAALLPPEVLAKLDGWLAPYVKEGAATSAGNIAVRNDLQKMAWLAGHMDDVQVQLGASILYSELTDGKESQKAVLRRTVLQDVARRQQILRPLATLTAKQWAKLKGAGLSFGYDLTPEQQSALPTWMLMGQVPRG